MISHEREATGKSRQAAFNILSRHPDCLRDDVVLNDLIEDIAAAIDGAERGDEA